MIIGIASRCLIENQTKKIFVNEDYIKFVKRYNLIPLIIPFNDIDEKILSLCDCFLIPGGNDIDAKYYHRKNHPDSILVDPLVDQLDFKILDYAVKNKRPVLGICRGLQVINVYFGGSLVQHIKSKIHENALNHHLKINDSSYFKNLFSKPYIINSFHHQKIDKLGNNLIVEGTCKMAIELITHRSLPIIACQYHLEKIDDNNTDQVMKYFLKSILF